MPSNKHRLAWASVLATSAFLGSVACGSSSEAPAVQANELPEGPWLDGADPKQVLATSFCASPQPGDSPLRRLSNLEYKNTLLSLGFTGELVESAVLALPSEPESLGFRNGASALTVTSLMAQNYEGVAEDLSTDYTFSCDSAEESACADTMIAEVGAKTHRRPLTDAEKAAYRGIYDQATEFFDHDESLGWVMRSMLQSPHFLYRVEIPDPSAVSPVTGYEMANRLSYMLWQAPPDDALRTLVQAGQLETKEQVLEQALRMLGDPRAESVLDFFRQWLDLDELHEVERDATLYPSVSGQLASLFKAETESFLLHLLRQSGASYRDLLGAEYTFVNAELAEHYGHSAVEGDAFEMVEVPGRHGILTQGMLAAQDGPTRTSIVRRGLKIRTDFLCQTVPAPPDTVDLTLDGLGKDLTQAQRLRQHREDVSCAKCHTRMDPLGQVFEGFDAVGRARSVDEYGNAIVTDGEVTDSIDADGPVTDVADLADRLAGSVEAQQCYLVQNLRYYLGREVSAQDLCTQAQLTQYWRDRELSLTELLVGLTQTDAFLYKAQRVDAPGATGAPGSGGDQGGEP